MNHTKLKFSAIAVSLAIGLSACSGESTEQKTKNVEVESVKQMESARAWAIELTTSRASGARVASEEADDRNRVE